MIGLVKHPLRVISRSLWLGFELLAAAFHYFRCVAFCTDSRSLQGRARWLQAGSRRVLRVFDSEIQVAGPIPKSGLLVSNHLSYFDILVLSALTPCVFIAKSEVRKWPILGWFACLAGTLFADRRRRTQVGPLTSRIQTALDAGTLVVLFPEGTSSGGRDVLPFKSALLEPATNPAYPLTASHIGYELEDGNVAEEVCYWKDMDFASHLLNLLSKRRIRTHLRFSGLGERRNERKELARQLHAEVSNLKTMFDQRSFRIRSQAEFQSSKRTLPYQTTDTITVA
jgi:lyso-ornithine lipid O-acyltransferase